MNVILVELRKVQEALGKQGFPGYLSAFPFEHFDRLRRLQGVWAPFYVVRGPHSLLGYLLGPELSFLFSSSTACAVCRACGPLPCGARVLLAGS